MDIVTDSFDKITLVQLQNKLSQKFEQLNKLESKEVLENSTRRDYIEQTKTSANYDEQDFARVLERFKKIDAQVRSHEQAHATIGHTTTPISYTYQEGLDGKIYAVGGSVKVDTLIPNVPKAAAFKLDQIQRAASTSIDTSGADNQIVNQSNLNKILMQLKEDKNAS